MESVFLSELTNSRLFAFGAVLKAAYLTTYRVGVFGNATGMISDWSFFCKESPRFKRQLLLTSSFDELTDVAEQAYAGLDLLKGKKYLNAKDLKLKAMGDAIIKKVEEAFVAGINANISRFRLGFYSELKKEGELLVHGLMSKENPGDPPFTPHSVSESMILKFELPGETPDVFWLEPEFFDPKYGFEMEWITHPDQFTASSLTAQLLPIFDLPSTSHLSATETKYLKRELKPEAEAWNEALNPFLDYYLRKKGEKPNAEILEAIAAQSKALNEAIARSSLLANSGENDESIFYHPLQVILGFLPTPMLWKFYEAHNHVNATTMEMLEGYKTDPAYIPFQPVFLVKSRLSNYFDDNTELGKAYVPAELKAVKKSIEL